MKCPFCNSDTIEVPDFEDADSYGEFHHICEFCGAVGQEIFGHGISWKKGCINKENSNNKVKCDAKQTCTLRFTSRCKTCAHNKGNNKEKNCYVPL